MKSRLARISERLNMSCWLLPTLCVAEAVGLS